MQMNGERHYIRRLLAGGVVAAFALFHCSSAVLARDFKTVDDVVKWHRKVIVTKSDLDEEVKSFLNGKAELDGPGLIKADFDGDGSLDVALLTVDRKRDDAYIRIYVCREVCLLKKAQLVGARGGVYLQKVPPAATVEQTKALPGSRKAVLLKNTGIRVVTFGKAAVVYYWDAPSNSIHSITTAD